MNRQLLRVLALFLGLISLPVFASAQTNSAGIVIERIPEVNFANPGTEVNILTKIINRGSIPVSGLTISESWPADFQVDNLTTSQLTWQIDSLLPGQSKANNLPIKVADEAVATRYLLQTVVTGQSPKFSQSLDYAFEVRTVKILASEFPATGGWSQADQWGAALIIELLALASLFFSWGSKNYD